jgi:hypothetical protein
MGWSPSALSPSPGSTPAAFEADPGLAFVAASTPASLSFPSRFLPGFQSGNPGNAPRPALRSRRRTAGYDMSGMPLYIASCALSILDQVYRATLAHGEQKLQKSTSRTGKVPECPRSAHREVAGRGGQASSDQSLRNRWRFPRGGMADPEGERTDF